MKNIPNPIVISFLVAGSLTSFLHDPELKHIPHQYYSLESSDAQLGITMSESTGTISIIKAYKIAI